MYSSLGCCLLGRIDCTLISSNISTATVTITNNNISTTIITTTTTTTTQKIIKNMPNLMQYNINNNCQHLYDNDNNNENKALTTFIIPSTGRRSLLYTLNSLYKQTNPNWLAIVIIDHVLSEYTITNDTEYNKLYNMYNIPVFFNMYSKHITDYSRVCFYYPTTADTNTNNTHTTNTNSNNDTTSKGHNSDGNSNIVLVKSKSNCAGELRNTAMSMVHTPWVSFVDDDDTLHETYVESLYNITYTHINTKCVIFRMTDGQGECPPKSHKDFIISQVGISFSYQTILYKQYNIKFTLSSAEDYLLLHTIREFGYEIYLSQKVLYYIKNKHTGNPYAAGYNIIQYTNYNDTITTTNSTITTNSTNTTNSNNTTPESALAKIMSHKDIKCNMKYTASPPFFDTLTIKQSDLTAIHHNSYTNSHNLPITITNLINISSNYGCFDRSWKGKIKNNNNITLIYLSTSDLKSVELPKNMKNPYIIIDTQLYTLGHTTLGHNSDPSTTTSTTYDNNDMSYTEPYTRYKNSKLLMDASQIWILVTDPHNYIHYNIYFKNKVYMFPTTILYNSHIPVQGKDSPVHGKDSPVQKSPYLDYMCHALHNLYININHNKYNKSNSNSNNDKNNKDKNKNKNKNDNKGKKKSSNNK